MMAISSRNGNTPSRTKICCRRSDRGSGCDECSTCGVLSVVMPASRSKKWLTTRSSDLAAHQLRAQYSAVHAIGEMQDLRQVRRNQQDRRAGLAQLALMQGEWTQIARAFQPRRIVAKGKREDGLAAFAHIVRHLPTQSSRRGAPSWRLPQGGRRPFAENDREDGVRQWE